MIAEIVKSYYYKGVLEPPLYFYRDKDMNEIDLLIDKIPNVRRSAGGVICLYDNLVTLKGSDRVIPVKFL